MKIIRQSLPFIILISALFSFGCSKSKSSANTAPSKFQLSYTGNLIGSIDPCNCKGAPLGGFARRASMMKESGVTTNSLLVDAGSFVSLSQKQPLEKTILVLLGLREIGVDAISIGYRDTHRLTAIQLKEMEKEYNFPFISANLISLQDETLLFPAYKIVEVDGENGKNRVGVIGVVQGGPYREIPVEQGMKITDPVEAITETITKISGSVEFIILLTDAPQPTIAAWLVQAATNEINLIITSSGRVNHRRNLDIEGVPLFSAGKQGKYFDIIIAQPEEGGWIISREFEDLGPTTKDDEKMAHFINEMISTLGITER